MPPDAMTKILTALRGGRRSRKVATEFVERVLIYRVEQILTPPLDIDKAREAQFLQVKTDGGTDLALAGHLAADFTDSLTDHGTHVPIVIDGDGAATLAEQFEDAKPRLIAKGFENGGDIDLFGVYHHF
jgi:hypothetical protein